MTISFEGVEYAGKKTSPKMALGDKFDIGDQRDDFCINGNGRMAFAKTLCNFSILILTRTIAGSNSPAKGG